MSLDTSVFLSKLKTVVEGADTNIGFVFETKKKWMRPAEVEEDASFKILAAGVLDAANRVGLNVLRFWMLDPRIESTPLTNDSVEYKVTVTVTGFFQREDADTQEASLRDAVEAIMNTLNLKVTQLTTLDTGGSGYMGYLQALPAMLTPIQSAVLDDSGIAGHVVQFTVTYFEEVSQS